MSDWTWGYDPNAQRVVGGLPADSVRRIENLARRLADAASAQHIGDPPIEESGISLHTIAEGTLLVWYLEHRRDRAVYITNVKDLEAD